MIGGNDERYPCPYCSETYHRDDLVKHIERKHDEKFRGLYSI